MPTLLSHSAPTNKKNKCNTKASTFLSEVKGKSTSAEAAAERTNKKKTNMVHNFIHSIFSKAFFFSTH